MRPGTSGWDVLGHSATRNIATPAAILRSIPHLSWSNRLRLPYWGTMRVATLSEMLGEVVRLGEATGMGDHAHELRGELEGRLATVRAEVTVTGSPRVI